MTASPSDEQRQRAKWDQVLLHIELRSEQLRHQKGYNPIGTEMRLEQLRQIKVFEPRRMIIQGLTAAAALMAAGGVIGGLLANLLRYSP